MLHPAAHALGELGLVPGGELGLVPGEELGLVPGGELGLVPDPTLNPHSLRAWGRARISA